MAAHRQQGKNAKTLMRFDERIWTECGALDVLAAVATRRQQRKPKSVAISKFGCCDQSAGMQKEGIDAGKAVEHELVGDSLQRPLETGSMRGGHLH